MTFVSFLIIGALIGFLRYNLSGSDKLFMGDSGSMFVGFLLAYQAISFLGLNDLPESSLEIPNAPILAIAALSYPILDTLRVFIIRIRLKRSPFYGDRNHIHHRLLYLGFKHKQATILIAITNLFIIGISILMSNLYVHVQLFIMIVFIPVLFLSPFLMVREKGKLKLVIPRLL